MDLAVLIVGIIIGVGAGYMIWGPGKKHLYEKPEPKKESKPTYKNPNED